MISYFLWQIGIEYQTARLTGAKGCCILLNPQPIKSLIVLYQITCSEVKFNPLTFTMTSNSKITQMKPSEEKFTLFDWPHAKNGCCFVIYQLAQWRPPRSFEVIQEYLNVIPIYQVGNHWLELFPYHKRCCLLEQHYGSQTCFLISHILNLE